MKFKSLLLNMARRFGYRPIADTPFLGEKIDYVEAKSTGEMGQILWEIHHGNHEKGMHASTEKISRTRRCRCPI